VILTLPTRLPLTADDFARISLVEGLRLELFDGNLDVGATAQTAWHSTTRHRIANLLGVSGRAVTTGTAVVLGARTVREPDVSRALARGRHSRGRDGRRLRVDAQPELQVGTDGGAFLTER
jgi:Uma2 family endonuclease